MGLLLPALAGLLFGLGLAVSQMMNPAKVLNFLDLAGNWDPSLALVMGGALAVTLPGFAWLRGRPRPWAAPRFAWPQATDIDAPLLGGAALFGLGWGLSGLCPGPALAGLVTGQPLLFGFVLALLLGYRGTAWLQGRTRAA